MFELYNDPTVRMELSHSQLTLCQKDQGCLILVKSSALSNYYKKHSLQLPIVEVLSFVYCTTERGICHLLARLDEELK